MKTEVRKTIISIILFLSCIIPASAQFADMGGNDPFGNNRMGNQNGMNGRNTSSDSTEQVDQYTIKRYFKSLAHKDTMAIGWAFAGSILLPGTGQIYNGDYWKLPILYCGIGGMIGGGCYYNSQFKKTGSSIDKRNSNIFFIGAAVFYWAQLLDGAASYQTYRPHLPGRATVYSTLLPGLGQIYNREYWKLPIYYTALAVSGYCWYYNNMQYRRFQSYYIKASNPDGGYTGTLSAENLQYYRDLYRRYRDYSILATVLLYILQIIDADVFGTMSDLNDSQPSVSMKLEPTVIYPISTDFNHSYAVTGLSSGALGFQLSVRF